MLKVELVYFNGCPNIARARSAIYSAGVTDLIEVEVNQLLSDHSYQKYSSPTILVDGKILVGSQNESSACSVADWGSIPELLRQTLEVKL